jgi:glutathione synthase/RimK-type ligase-like ATP-grasp enzyme
VEQLSRLAHAPAIFQRYVPYGREYRVSYVAGELFVAEIAITREAARYDWRIDCDYETLPSVLDGDTAAKLRVLMDDLGLASGAIDLRETPEGQVYFLEVNPSGQFLFLDVFAGMNVADAFCDMLLRES